MGKDMENLDHAWNNDGATSVARSVANNMRYRVTKGFKALHGRIKK